MFNILAIAQSGRLQYEAILLAASLRAHDPAFKGRLFLATPNPGPLWDHDPRITDAATLSLLADLGAELLPFDSRHFGSSYPYGNKIEAITHLPEEPFLFLDTDTLVTGPLSALPFDFARPSASMKREGTWPQPDLYGPGYTDIWKSLYDRFGLDFAASLDLSQPDEYWQRYLYFNAGWFFHESPRRFGKTFLRFASEIAAHPGAALACQSLDPWLDQIALPLVIHALGGGRPPASLGALDTTHSCHWRLMPLLYARESDDVVAKLEALAHRPEIAAVLRGYPPFKRMIYQQKGAEVRALFDRANLPRKEQAMRNTIKRAGLWTR
ncbi:hypothetical protein [Paragemmobacter straminiformis]|uniref:Uncharacterized protein n=1 Tax=Paragemmobacter straminiformis TaxID=2045119 RepID=A0A842I1X7_9RHOB|nr:hypothetical protein [Gemmobacter straminiformis]MBC2833896.1 hypothetical protein [Gemmobacter straminiformis]